MARVYRVALLPEPQPEGGYAVTSPAPTGLVAGDDSLQQALANVEDALRATLGLYEDTGRPIPSSLRGAAATAVGGCAGDDQRARRRDRGAAARRDGHAARGEARRARPAEAAPGDRVRAADRVR